MEINKIKKIIIAIITILFLLMSIKYVKTQRELDINKSYVKQMEEQVRTIIKWNNSLETDKENLEGYIELLKEKINTNEYDDINE